MQSEFTALQAAMHDNELEARVWTNKNIFKLIKYITIMAKLQIK